MLNLKAQIMEDIKSFMRQQEKNKLKVLRGVSAAIKQKEVDDKVILEKDSDIESILTKLAKQRIDSINQFKEAGREDLVSQEQFELSIIEAYLPKKLSAEELNKELKIAIKDLAIVDVKQMGQLMVHLKEKLGASADMKLLSKLVKESFN